MNCMSCKHYELKKMITSGRPMGYAGDIPCIRCSEFKTSSEYIPKREAELINDYFINVTPTEPSPSYNSCTTDSSSSSSFDGGGSSSDF